MASGLVFATVGTTKFDTFVATLTQQQVLSALKNKGYSKIRIQIGNGEVIPNEKEAKKLGIDLSYFRFKDSIREEIKNADLVISHAGAGSCLEVLDEQKPLLVVINEDLMNNHQIELAEQLSADGHLYACRNSTLQETISAMDLSKLKVMPKADSKIFARHLNNYMGFKD